MKILPSHLIISNWTSNWTSNRTSKSIQSIRNKLISINAGNLCQQWFANVFLALCFAFQFELSFEKFLLLLTTVFVRRILVQAIIDVNLIHFRWRPCTAYVDNGNPEGNDELPFQFYLNACLTDLLHSPIECFHDTHSVSETSQRNRRKPTINKSTAGSFRRTKFNSVASKWDQLNSNS